MQQKMKKTVIDLIEATFECSDGELQNNILRKIQLELEDEPEHYEIKVCNNDEHTTTEIVEHYLEQLKGDNEMMYDIIKFFKLMGFIEIADEYDLSAGPSQIDEYNEAVIQTEMIAKKYGLYDNDQACNDPWYHLHTLWPKMKEFFLEKLYEPTKKGDDTMKVNEEIELSGILEMDLEEIREHFKNNTDDWIFDHDLSQWIYMPTNQTIRGYILSNIETILSPNLLKEDVEKILWFENFEEILDELSDIELLTTLTTQEQTDKNHKIYLFGTSIYITPKQWRKVIDKAVERFIRRDK